MTKTNYLNIMITGASSGIGRALAIMLSKQGNRCILIARRIDKLEETLALMDKTREHILIPFDLLKLDEYNVIYNRLNEEHVVLDGFVHCAGVAPIIPLRVLSYKAALEVFQCHYFSFIELVKYYAQKGHNRGGSIVSVSSINAHVPKKCMTAYSSAKGAVETASKTLSIELFEKGIRINTVVIGNVDTEMTQNNTRVVAGLEETKQKRSLNHNHIVGKPDDVAKVISYLLSEDSSFINGSLVYADGGYFEIR